MKDWKKLRKKEEKKENEGNWPQGHIYGSYTKDNI